MAPQAARWVPTAMDGAWTAPMHKQGVSARLQRAVGVNIASCNGRVKVSESVKTTVYMYFEAGKPVVTSDFDEGGSPKL